MRDDGEIVGPITSDNPVKVDEMLLTESDKVRLEGFAPEDRHAELKRMNEARLRALSQDEYDAVVIDAGDRLTQKDPPQVVDSDYDKKVAIAYNLMRDALLGPPEPPKTPEDIAKKQADKAKRRRKAKAAKKSKQRNR